MKKNKLTPFWRLSGPNIRGVSYLLGTMHLKPLAPKSQWPAPYANYIDLCKVFATEFPMNEVKAGLLGEFSLLPDNQSLTDLLTEKQLKKLEKNLLKSLGLPIRSLLRMKPLLVVNLISERLLADANPISMDKDLWQVAEAKGKILKGVETFEEQLHILERIPIKYQLKNLLSIAKDIGKYKRQLLHLSEIYDAGDMQQLYKVSKKGIGPIRKFMLTDRNQVMADRIMTIASEASLFCAIGAGHLAGKKGVLRLLKQQGLTIKPIIFK